MNRPESKPDKENVTNHPHNNDDCIAQLPTTSLPGSSTDQVFAYKHRTLDGWVIDEMPTFILPVISKRRGMGTATKSQKTTGAATESPLTPVRNLLKSSGIYAIASVATPLISLVLAPFLTHHLSPTDYGMLTILNTLIGLGAGITQLGLYSAFFRAYGYDYTSRHDRRDVLATVTALLCLVSLSTIIVVVLTAPLLATLLFGRPSLGSFIVLAGTAILVQNLTIPSFAWLRAESRALFYTLLAIGNLLITLIANVALVGILHLGVAGSLLATIIGYASMAICTLPIIFLHAGIRIRADITRSLLAFGLPLLLNFVSYWVLQLSDRYLLSLFASLAQTAWYAVAYTVGSALSIVVVSPFTIAWPTAMFAIARRKDAAQVFRLVFRWFSMLLLFAAFALSLAGTLLLDWFFPTTYRSAAPIIPIVAASLVFYGIYFVFMVGANVTRKTWLTAVFTTIAAIVNVAINLALIPHYGSMGAAISTLLAYLVLAAVAYVVNQRIYPTPFDIGIFVIAFLAGIALYIGSDFLAQAQAIYVAWAIRVCTLVLYGGGLAFLGMLPVWSHKDRRYAQEDSVS